MLLSRLVRVLAGALSLMWTSVSGAAVAASPVETVAPAINDRVTDPAAAAIKQALHTGLERGILASKDDAAAIAEYYAQQGHVPSWTAEGRLTERGVAISKRIAAAQEDGLDPIDYPMPPIGLGTDRAVDLAQMATADVMLSQAIVSYARDAYSGRVLPST